MLLSEFKVRGRDVINPGIQLWGLWGSWNCWRREVRKRDLMAADYQRGVVSAALIVSFWAV